MEKLTPIEKAIGRELHADIMKVVDRVFDEQKINYPGDRLSLYMDLEATNEIIPLDFDRFMESGDSDFYHDIAGIARHFNRETKQMNDGFCPRLALKQVSDIEDVYWPRTAKSIVRMLTKAPVEDKYSQRIIQGAKAMYGSNRGHWRYLTQYGSGRCLWESKACTEANTDRMTVYTNGEAIEDLSFG